MVKRVAAAFQTKPILWEERTGLVTINESPKDGDGSNQQLLRLLPPRSNKAAFVHFMDFYYSKIHNKNTHTERKEMVSAQFTNHLDRDLYTALLHGFPSYI